MEPILAYLFKSALILGGFLAVYHLFLKRDTFFTENRLFLVAGLLLSLVFPLIKFQNTIIVDQPMVVATRGNTATTVVAVASPNLFTLENILITIYVLVTLFFLVRFILQLSALKRLERDAKTWKEHPYLHVETAKRIAPFSFFNHIFYNPSLFNSKELGIMLAHEKVHARQLHTLDIVLLELIRIVFWFNPILWFYKTAIKQNLEYLADRYAVEGMENIKSYQYLMLKQVVNKPEYAVTNSFYNSLIKKRIVMLNQNQSKRTSVFKTLLVLPLLGLFLVSFSVENVYLYKKSEDALDTLADKTVEFTIDKNTTDTELDKIKKDLVKDGIDFSYTTIRNDAREIIDISLNLSGKSSTGAKFSGNYSSNSEGPIDPIQVFYDDEANTVSFGNAKQFKYRIHKTDGDKIHWETDDETEIVIRKENANKVVIVNGKRLTDEEVEEMEMEKGSTIFISSGDDDDEDKITKKIKVKRVHKDDGHVMIIKDSDNDKDIEVIGDDDSFFYIDTDGNKEPLFYVDGKKVKKEDIKKLDPSSIESMQVLKGDQAIKKYGKKGKDGVVEITIKKSGN
ncbi:M56 family metallopeptidase [Flagellimonas beolgyonensis]|uniref:M56 family metallopeptidase n=1 Tax=Flagellimonas beolgyonensis TaxID=864064 RepID=UPI000F8F8118|nr:M56 family metallopeptidase [Allomuricauda beolgyonensis]